MSLEREARLHAEVDQLKAALVREQQARARAETRTADLIDAVYQAAKDAAVVVGQAAPVPRPGRDRRRSPEVALLHLSDFQAGKVTPSYDLATCSARVRLAVAKAVKLAEIARADHPVRTAVLALGGDLVEGGGNIFPGQIHEIQSGVFTQLFHVAGLVEEAVLTLLDAFESVVVYEVAGNHARIGKRGDYAREDNVDAIVGKIARDRLSNQPRLTWHEPGNWFQVIECGAYRALLCHGDQIKSFGGNVPAYGILRKANAWAAGAVREPFRDVLMGHFHTPMQLTLANGGTVWVNGSPESDNIYAQEFVAAMGKPSQRLLFVDPKRGRVTSDFCLWLDEG